MGADDREVHVEQFDPMAIYGELAEFDRHRVRVWPKAETIAKASVDKLFKDCKLGYQDGRLIRCGEVLAVDVSKRPVSCCQYGLHCSKRLIDALLKTVAYHRVGNRPGRWEPRARKRRPERAARLMQPRAIVKLPQNRSKYF